MFRILPLVATMFPLALLAQTISGTSGSFEPGNSLTITGSSFGTKSPAAPMKWDDFEGGTVGNDLTGWTLFSSGGVNPKYASSPVRPGSARSAVSDFAATNNYTCSFELRGGPWDKLFISAYSRPVYSCNSGGACYDGQPSRNHKLIRITGDNGALSDPQGQGVPLSEIDRLAGSNGALQNALRIRYEPPPTISDTHWLGGTWRHDVWTKYEYYVDISGGDGPPANKIYLWQDFNDVTDFDRQQDELQQLGLGGSRFDEIKVGFYFSRDNGVTGQRYWDDVYIDNTLARVEVCNSATHAARNDCALQPPTAWSDSAITVTVNRGSFSDSQIVYIYVYDSDGNVNQNGFPITVGASAGTSDLPAPAAIWRDDTKQ